MKKILASAFMALLAAPLLADDASPKDTVIAAAKQLAQQPSYSWKQTVAVPDDAQFKPGPTEGKLEKGGVTYFTFSFGDNTTKIYLKGNQNAISGQDGGWQSLSEMGGDQGPGQFMGFIVHSFEAPAAQAEELAGAATSLKQDGDVISGDMSADGVKNQFKFGTVSDPKGSVKFWVKDGKLSKYEFKMTGKANFNGNDMDVDRDTTIEITDVGTTKVEVPADAQKKLDAPAPAAGNTTGDSAK
jgi:hypothetical protein